MTPFTGDGAARGSKKEVHLGRTTPFCVGQAPEDQSDLGETATQVHTASCHRLASEQAEWETH